MIDTNKYIHFGGFTNPPNLAVRDSQEVKSIVQPLKIFIYFKDNPQL